MNFPSVTQTFSLSEKMEEQSIFSGFQLYSDFSSFFTQTELFWTSFPQYFQENPRFLRFFFIIYTLSLIQNLRLHYFLQEQKQTIFQVQSSAEKRLAQRFFNWSTKTFCMTLESWNSMQRIECDKYLLHRKNFLLIYFPNFVWYFFHPNFMHDENYISTA